MHHCYLVQSQTKKYIFISINGDFFQHKGCQGVGLQCPMGLSNRVPGGQGVGLQGLKGSRVRSAGSQGVKGYAFRVPGGQGGV